MNSTYKDMLAQMLFVGIPNKKSISGVIDAIKKHHIGGVILYKNNYNSLEEMIDLINQLKKANEKNNIPLCIAIDQEGGRVNRLPKEFNNIKSASRLCKSGPKAVSKASNTSASVLRDLGIHMNFAPVLDIRNQNDDNAFIGNRAYSNNVDEIVLCAKRFIKEYNKVKVIPVCKHYPGHGSVNIDSHLFLPIIKNFSKNTVDLKPFVKLGNDAPAVMVSHILINGYTNFKPASLSKKFIQDFIKKENNYNGLIITDELGMKAVRLLFGKYRSVRLAYEANNDIICCKYHEGYIDKLLDNLICDTKISITNIKGSYDKILDYKKKYSMDDKQVKNKLDLKNINKEIDKINNMKE